MNFKKIESKWQKAWEKAKIFEVKEGKKKKFYCLEMWPYPSGSGLHLGHAFNYSIGDAYARFKRMNGFNVLYPVGYDSFGLPAENAAIKAKSHPKRFTEKAIKNYIRQQKELGLSYDWTRLTETHKPDYYKWDQWIFLEMYKKGLAYRKKAAVNFCLECNTVLANEQVVNGNCWRHDETPVVIRELEQWFLKITDYADELDRELEKLDWPEDIKAMQKNWIGKSHGTQIDFKIEGTDETVPVFTTRIDTIYGVTFLVYAPEHPKVMELVKGTKHEMDVKKFVNKVLLEDKFSRTADDKEKEGLFIGKYAINPLTNEKVPIYIGNFVLLEYGGGCVMAVPGHDQRDFEFAKKYNIPIRVVIQPKDHELNAFKMSRAYTGDGNLVNSDKFDGLNNKEAIEEINKYLKKKKLGGKTTQYKIRDWLISRQRFWGCPIPIIKCDECGPVAVPEKDLPVKLPNNIKFKKEKNPLETTSSFYEAKCPKCKGNGKRETDTMDTFIDSSWYFLRYCDPKNDKKIFDLKKATYWMPIDLYIGGREHATGHLIYCRFLTKFLRDLGLLKFDEPAKKLFNQGMLHGADGEKMSKSKGNVVLPEDISNKYGIDTARLFLLSIASPDKDIDWSDTGISGSHRFINKVFDYFKGFKPGKDDRVTEHKINKAVKEVTEAIEAMRYNMAIISIRQLFESMPQNASKGTIETALKLLHPFCPHITEELWEKIGNKPFISVAKWPVSDKKKINAKIEEQEKAVSGLSSDIRKVVELLESKGQTVSKIYVYVLPKELGLYESAIDFLKANVDKEVVVYSVSDKDKYDPESKSKKAKPGKPALYVE